MQRTILLSTLSLLLLKATLGDEGSLGRIYGGNELKKGGAPYMAYIVIFHGECVSCEYLKAEACGGSILTTKLILTGAHCAKDPEKRCGQVWPAKWFEVYVGSNTKHAGDLHHVKNVYVLPKYTGQNTNFYHDVALLELMNDITLNRHKGLVALALPTDKPKAGDDVYSTGWGDNPQHAETSRLYQVHLKVVAAKQCHDGRTPFVESKNITAEIEQHNICAKAKNKNSCQGDSGGPLIDASTNRQIGAVSWGERCPSDSPGYYARITDNLDFIQGVMSYLELC